MQIDVNRTINTLESIEVGLAGDKQRDIQLLIRALKLVDEDRSKKTTREYTYIPAGI